jgi:hypothetical protein
MLLWRELTMNVESNMLLIQALLLVLIVLVWQVFRWLKVVAMNLGCNPKRTERINLLLNQLDRTNLSASELVLQRRKNLTRNSRSCASTKGLKFLAKQDRESELLNDCRT